MGNCSPGNIDSEDEEEKQFESYITSIKNLIEDDKLDMVNQETTTLPAQIESVILIQTHFRKHLSKKKLKKIFLEHLNIKRETLKNTINFKESWEIHFQKRNEYEFTIKGLKALEDEIVNFYNNFFDIEMIMNGSENITIQQMKQYNYASILSGSFRKIIAIYMNNSFYLGQKVEKEIIGFDINIEEYNDEYKHSLDMQNRMDLLNSDESRKTEENFNNLLNRLSNSNSLNASQVSAFQLHRIKSKFNNKDNLMKKSFSNSNGIIRLISMNNNNNNNNNGSTMYTPTTTNTNNGGGNYNTFSNVSIGDATPTARNNVLIASTLLQRAQKGKHYTLKPNINKDEFQQILRRQQQNEYVKTNAYNFNTDKSGKRKIFRNMLQLSIPNTVKTPLFNFQTNKLYLHFFLEQIKEYQDKNCTHNISFTDPKTKIIYSGSYDKKLKSKEGLGFEYMVDSSKGTIYKYCGYFYNNSFHGLGMLSNSKNEAFFGEFRGGKKNGYGFYYAENKTYTGFFKNNLYEGFGEINVKGKFTYCGLWKNGVRNGFGYYMSSDGNVFCGEFSEGKITGTGFFQWADGQNYIGSWKDNFIDGYGVFSYKNGDKFFGYYKNDVKHGKGVYQFKNGVQLKGKWIKGKKEGEFEYIDDKQTNVTVKYYNDVQLRT